MTWKCGHKYTHAICLVKKRPEESHVKTETELELAATSPGGYRKREEARKIPPLEVSGEHGAGRQSTFVVLSHLAYGFSYGSPRKLIQLY